MYYVLCIIMLQSTLMQLHYRVFLPLSYAFYADSDRGHDGYYAV